MGFFDRLFSAFGGESLNDKVLQLEKPILNESAPIREKSAAAEVLMTLVRQIEPNIIDFLLPLYEEYEKSPLTDADLKSRIVLVPRFESFRHAVMETRQAAVKLSDADFQSIKGCAAALRLIEIKPNDTMAITKTGHWVVWVFRQIESGSVPHSRPVPWAEGFLSR